jgi:hypothetical protein
LALSPLEGDAHASASRPCDSMRMRTLRAAFVLLLTVGCDTVGDECASEEDCLESQHCLFEDRLCGLGEPGYCIEFVGGRRDLMAHPPRCGCDGRIYLDDFARMAAGVDYTIAENCAAPLEWGHACGWRWCGDWFCVPPESGDDVDDYQCVAP